MNRTALAVLSIAGLASAILADPESRQTANVSYHSDQLIVTNISNRHMSFNTVSGVFNVQGAPTLHAVMPLKHMTVDASNLVGHVNSKTGLLKDATLTGGVHGTLDNAASKGTSNHVTFSSDSALYTDQGTQELPGADIDASQQVEFQSSNAEQGSRFSLTGSHGLFHLRSLVKGDMSVREADLDGPVTYSFSGVKVGNDKKSEPATGSGSAGHLHLTRGGDDGTDYVLRLTGGASIKGNAAGFDGDFPKTDAVTVIIDAAGNFKSLSTDDSVSGTLTPRKKA